MRCFEVDPNSVRPGLSVLRRFLDKDGVWARCAPYIDTPPDCLGVVELDQTVAGFIAGEVPDNGSYEDSYDVRVRNTDILAGGGTILLRPEPFEKPSTQALVRFTARAPVNGVVRLLASAFDEDMESGEVVTRHKEFPGAGVQPLCSDDYVEMMRAGTDEVDVLLIMNRKASFRLERSGASLEGAPEWLTVRWTGRDVILRTPRQRDAAAGAFAT